MDVEAEIDRLYTLPPGKFVAARDELVRRLREDGRREQAQQVKGLRRPTVAAWAVNQAVRRDREGVAALRDAALALRRAQQRLLAGVRRSGLQEATRARHDAVARLAAAAAAALEESGRSPDSHEAAVSGAFEAAVVDEETLEEVTAGRLGREPEPPAGFGNAAWLAAAPPPEEPESEPAAEPEREDAELARAREAAERARKRLEQARRDAAAADEEVTAARSASEEADAEVERLERRLSAAREQARASRRRVRTAERRAERAAATVRRREEEVATTEERLRQR